MNLTHLSDPEVLSGLMSLYGSERTMRAKVVAYLVEVEMRRIHLDLAYSSMHDFCQRHLGMSEGEAHRRVVAARLVARFPVLLQKLESGELHLSNLLLLKDYLTEGNFEELTKGATRATKRQVEEMLATRFPKPDAPQRIVEALAPGRYKLQLTVSGELMEKIQRVADRMRHSNPSGDLAVIFEHAIDALIPKLERKITRPQTHVRPSKPGHIAAETRREVFERDGHQCTFTDPAGKRCEGQTFLQIDHLIPRARGGTEDASNLALTCANHNLRRAEKVFGRKHVEQWIHFRQRRFATPTTVTTTAVAEHPKKAPTNDISAPANLLQRGSTSEVVAATPEKEPDVYERARTGLIGMGFPASDARRVMAGLRESLPPTTSVADTLKAGIRALRPWCPPER